MDYLNSGYCESLKSILDSEAKITTCSEKLLCQKILKWLDQIPDEGKRIKLLTDVLAAYSNRTCAMSSLICSSNDLIKCCCRKNINYTNYVGNGCYILEKVMLFYQHSCTSAYYFLVYDSICNKTTLCKYSSKYDCDKLKLAIFCIN